MVKCKTDKLWLEYIPNLFCSFNLIPLEGMSLAQQMNALTRLILLVTLVLHLMGFKHSFLFLLLALLFIIIIYYIQRKTMNEAFKAEHFTSCAPTPPPPKGTRYYTARPYYDSDVSFAGDQLVYNDTTNINWANAVKNMDKNVFNNEKWISPSQRLAGKPNPKTKIPPPVIAPATDLSYWKANNMVVHSHINDDTPVDVYRSGYQVSTCCAPSYDGGATSKYAVPVGMQLPAEFKQNDSGCSRENYQPSSQEMTSLYGTSSPICSEMPSARENFTLPENSSGDVIEPVMIRPAQPGQVNMACGYNPEQLETAGLPTNLPAGNCAKNPAMKTYNERLFTQTIQPGVTTRTEINQPINSNIGISFNQQFPPTSKKVDPVTGNISYVQHDPRIIEPVKECLPNMGVEDAVRYDNVYDPRFSGYGTSYRAYTDEKLGQTKFYYDDINAVRMPNYIVRSNIDHQPFADQYGPMKAGDSMGNKFNPNIRALAHDAFLTATLQQRDELSERAMRKINANSWQQRVAPIRRGGQYMAGGLSGTK